MKFKIILSTIVIVAVLIVGYALSGGSQILDRARGEKQVSRDASKPVKPELPEFAWKTARVAEAYIYAVQNPDKLLSHKSLKDCYLKPDGSYEPHASECKLCNDITLEARDLLMKGYSLKDIRKIIDDVYSGRGVGTNTMLPP